MPDQRGENRSFASMILRRMEGSRYSEVSRGWLNETVVLLGGGPSLSGSQVRMVAAAHANRNVKCIAINDAYHLAPWADILYAADSRWYWWQQHGKASVGLSPEVVRWNWSRFGGEKCSIESGSTVNDEAVHVLRNLHGNKHGVGLSTNPRALVTGRNSGFQALNLAILAGAKRIVLLGFDGCPGGDGRSHWFGEHPIPTHEAVYGYIRQSMMSAKEDIAAAGAQVLNASPGSAINAFEKVSLCDVL